MAKMKTFKVYAIRSETIVTEVLANSLNEAISLADDNFIKLTWKEVDDSMSTVVTLAEALNISEPQK